MKESVPTPGPVRVNFILGDKTVFSKMWQLFTYFETDSLGSFKILPEYRFSSEFCQVQVVFEFFEIKNKTKKLQNMQRLCVIEWWSIFKSVSNDNQHV